MKWMFITVQEENIPMAPCYISFHIKIIIIKVLNNFDWYNNCNLENWKMKNDEKWKMKNEKCKMKNEKCKMKNEKWKMKNEKWKMILQKNKIISVK